MGAAHALNSSPKPTCRNWANAIWATAREKGELLDGLEVRSTLTGKKMAVLFHDSQDALPSVPEYSSPLSGPFVFSIACEFARVHDWTIV